MSTYHNGAILVAELVIIEGLCPRLIDVQDDILKNAEYGKWLKAYGNNNPFSSNRSVFNMKNTKPNPTPVTMSPPSSQTNSPIPLSNHTQCSSTQPFISVIAPFPHNPTSIPPADSIILHCQPPSSSIHDHSSLSTLPINVISSPASHPTYHAHDFPQTHLIHSSSLNFPEVTTRQPLISSDDQQPVPELPVNVPISLSKFDYKSSPPSSLCPPNIPLSPLLVTVPMSLDTPAKKAAQKFSRTRKKILS